MNKIKNLILLQIKALQIALKMNKTQKLSNIINTALTDIQCVQTRSLKNEVLLRRWIIVTVILERISGNDRRGNLIFLPRDIASVKRTIDS